jgi:hypothetical protein
MAKLVSFYVDMVNGVHDHAELNGHYVFLMIVLVQGQRFKNIAPLALNL